MTSEKIKKLEINGREFKPAFAASVFDAVQSGTMKSVYRNVPFFKNPFDIGIYLQLLGQLAPKTIFEIGTKYGGSALFFADILNAQGVNVKIISIDIAPLASFKDERIDFLQGDAKSLGKTINEDMLNLPHPWLIIEDSSHFYDETKAVLEYFSPKMQSGDYLIVEDGIVNTLTDEMYLAYEDGPSRAVFDFLSEHPEDLEIDTRMCDFYRLQRHI